MLLRVLSWFFAVLIGLLGLLWLFSPQLFSLVIAKQLAPYKLTMNEQAHIRLNPFLLSLTVEELTLHSASEKVFGLKNGEMQLSFSAIFRKNIHFQHFELSGIYLPLNKVNESWQVLGQKLPNESSNSEGAETQTDNQWQLSADTIDLLNSQIVLNANETHTLNIDEVGIESLTYATNDQHLDLEFSGKINAAPITLDTKLDLIGQHYTGRISLENVTIANFAEWFPNDFNDVSATVGVSTNFTIKQKTTTNISLSDTKLSVIEANIPRLNQQLSLTAGQIDLSADALNLAGNDVSTNGLNLLVSGITSKVLDDDSQAKIDTVTFKSARIGYQNEQLSLEGADLNIEDVSANSPNHGIEASLASIDWRLAILNYATNNSLISSSDLKISSAEIFDTKQALSLSLDDLSWQMPSLTMKEQQLSGVTSTKMSQLNVVNKATEALVLSVAEVMLPDVEISGQKQQLVTTANLLTINDIKSSKKHEELAPLAAIEQVLLKNIGVSYSPESASTHITANHLHVDKINANLIFENQVLKNLVALSNETAEEESSPENTKETEQANNLTYVIDLITTTGQLTVEDTVATPNFNAQIDFKEIRVEALDNTDATKVTRFQLSGNTGRHADFALKGDYQAFNPQMNMSIMGDINELALPKLVGYFAKGGNVNILSGQLDSQLDVKVVDNKISGNSELFVRGLELAKENKEQGSVEKNDSVISLNTALNMLQDSKGNLELDVPLSGDVSSPEFGLQSFIGIITQKAVMVAAESYLMQTVVPYGNVLSLAKIAGEMMLKIRIEDLVYQPQQVEISEQQTPFVTNLIKLMVDKPDLQFKVCAIATAADLPNEHSFDDKALVTYLHQLSEQRGQAFKDYLVQQGGISSKRLLLCHGQVEKTSEQSPRITFDS